MSPIESGDTIKYLANIVSISRMGVALLMLSTHFLSMSFWFCYFWCGVSDVLDGFLARKLHQQSKLGTKLDSVSDGVFAVSIFIIVLTKFPLPTWLWSCIALIALLRFIGYGIGFFKYHTFSSLHTLLNKITGLFIFAFPLLYKFVGLNASAIIICIMALISSVEEVVIVLKEDDLDRDTKGIFM